MPDPVSEPTPELLEPQDCEALFDKVAWAAHSLGVDDVEAILGVERSALTRFANNAIHQNVAERRSHLSVRTVTDHRTARATTNRFDDESIRRVVEEAIALARLQESDPELLPLAEAGEYRQVSRWFDSTALVTPAGRAQAVAEAIDVVETAGQNAAGMYSTGGSVLAIMNSRGLSAYHNETMARFSITAMTGDSSGWAKASSCYEGDLDCRRLASIASQKASGSRAPIGLPPGRYTIVLEPAAVLDLVGQMFGDFSGTALRDERSFLTGRIGTRLLGENITIRDDVYHPLQAGPPFDYEGVPRQKLALVEQGIVREIAYSRQAARLALAKPTGHGFPAPNEYGEAPANIVIEGGGSSVEEMIASTSRGILLTRVWYIREVDPYEKIMTGMTRDGAFLIDDGAIVGGVRDFRFNQSLIEMLNRVETLSPAVRASGEESPDMVAPAMKVREFNFTQ